MQFIFTIHKTASVPTLLLGSLVMGLGAIALPSLLKFLSAIAFPALGVYAVVLLALALYRLLEVRLGL